MFKTMKTITFTVSHKGKDLFDVSRLSPDINIDIFQKTLQKAFPPEKGYAIVRREEKHTSVVTCLS